MRISLIRFLPLLTNILYPSISIIENIYEYRIWNHFIKWDIRCPKSPCRLLWDRPSISTSIYWVPYKHASDNLSLPCDRSFEDSSASIWKDPIENRDHLRLVSEVELVHSLSDLASISSWVSMVIETSPYILVSKLWIGHNIVEMSKVTSWVVTSVRPKSEIY